MSRGLARGDTRLMFDKPGCYNLAWTSQQASEYVIQERFKDIVREVKHLEKTIASCGVGKGDKNDGVEWQSGGN